MMAIVFIASLALLLLTLWVLFRDFKSQQPLAMGWRNLYILGFCHFCLLSTVFLSSNVTNETMSLINRRSGLDTGKLPLLVLLHVVFLVITFKLAKAVSNKGTLSNLLPKFNLNPASSTLVATAVAGTSLAMLFSFVLPEGFVGLIFVQFRTGLSSVAAGVATYYLISQRFNPAAWALFVFALVGGILATTIGGSGRRASLSVLMAVSWMWWFASLRYQRPTLAATKVAVALVPMVLALLAYSAVRHQGVSGEIGARAFTSRIETFQEAVRDPEAVAVGLAQVLYQDTSHNTVYIMGHYPGGYQYRLLDDAIWFFANPIPRFMWPGKPEAFGIVLQHQMNSEANLGPGVIGHGWAAAGIFGVVVYCVFFAFLIGVVDGALKDRLFNPFFLAWIAADLGNVIALSRGDMALFTLQNAASLVAASLLIIGVKITAGPLAAGARPLMPPLWRKLVREQEEEEEDREFDDDGYSESLTD